MSIHAQLVHNSLALVAPELEVRTIHLLDRSPGGPAARLAAIPQARWRVRHVQADVLHWLDGSYAYLCDSPAWHRTLVTVHDLIPALQAAGRFPDVDAPGWGARQLIGSSLRAIRRAAAVCTVSEATSADLHQLTGRVADAVVPLCLRSLPSPAPAGVALPQRYLLHVGHNGFYKNRSAVIAVFAALASSFSDLQLVLAGAAPSALLQQQIASLGLTSWVQWRPNPSDAELVLLYRRAQLLLFPSLYEGFGWPPLEAMALDCPVVCSNAGSLPEVVGDGALSCDPHDIQALTVAARQLLESVECRAALIAKGRANLQRFSARRMGEQLLNLYEGLHRSTGVASSAG